MLTKLTRGTAGVALGLLVLAAAPASAATTGSQRFTFLIREAPDESSCQVAAAGPISGVGTCVLDEQSEEVTVVHVTLPTGTLELTVTNVEHSSQFNQQACVFRFTETETFTITGGTGAYAAATGSGTDVLQGVFVLPRSADGCDRSQERGVIVARATGTASV